MKKKVEIKKEIIFTLEDISVSYRAKTIIHNFDTGVFKGDFISVTGKSGSGKSTLLYLLGGFLKPSIGAYFFQNKRVYKMGEFGLGQFRKKNIGFLFQDFRLLPFLTIEQNIAFPIYFTGEKISQDRVDYLLDLFGLTHRKSAFPADISGGEAQRTALARALLLEPKLLLLDEPTGNLDFETEKEVLDLLLDLKQKGLTLICVTHSREISKQSDFIWELKNGKINISRNKEFPAGKILKKI
jgi:ABC-type lipoprotein export system ATPase subunit